MSWQQTAPGVYVRPFDTIELFYRGIAASGAHLQREQYLISSAVRFKDAVSPADLRQAWKALIHKYPQQATVADESGSQLTYTVLSPESLDAWVEKMLIVYPESDTRSAEDLDVALSPSPVLMGHYLPASRELLFRTPHWRSDGIGLILLQDAFFTLLAEGSSTKDFVFDGSEISRFPATMDSAASINMEVTPEISQGADAQLAALFTGSAPAVFDPALPNNLPGESRRMGTHLSREESQKIIAASKARGLTVTVAVHAALLCVMLKYATPADGRLISFTTYNVRDRLPAPWNGSAAAGTVYHTGRPCSVEFGANKTYDEIAKFLTTDYKRDLQPLFDFMASYVPKIGAMLAAPLELALQAPGGAHPELSSLGDLDKRLKSRYEGAANAVEVQDWWLGVEIINRLLQSYLWTRNGELHIAHHYNEAFYDRAFVEQVMREWKATIVKELIG
ncbi:hypothetical protein PISL3812_09043 [Talaromyces islandicus]|uniref:Uncharacterized protein n=1 Tax=Talaromyces islandicus TaxID=28573 RepID=A0A0U1M8T4_TALIS|nr:hypothetical protein PISL3812_09043 [Talaromyces islandicus]